MSDTIAKTLGLPPIDQVALATVWCESRYILAQTRIPV